MDKRLKEIQDGLGLLITETVTLNMDGHKRCISPKELDEFTKWMDMIDEMCDGKQSQFKNAALPIFDVAAVLIVKL